MMHGVYNVKLTGFITQSNSRELQNYSTPLSSPMSRADSATICVTQIYDLVTSNPPQRRDNYMYNML